MLQRKIQQLGKSFYSEGIKKQYVGIVGLTEWELIQTPNQPKKKFNNSLE